MSLHRALSGRQTRRDNTSRSLGGWLWRILGIALFFQVVCYGWLLFRAQSFAQISDFTVRLFHVTAPGWSDLTVPALPQATLAGIVLLLVWDWCIEASRNERFYEAMPAPVRAFMWSGMLYFLAFGLTTATSAFIYFQF